MDPVAARRHALQNDPQLQRYVIPNVKRTGKQLGVGSYGIVEELEINSLICAGKRIHEPLIEAGNDGVQRIVRKYVEECQLMSDLRHPHIVQFLGVCFLLNSSLPVIVMERLLMSLDDLLKNIPDIPLALKRSILADVSKGLVYLHNRSSPIIHRDLSATNVLLNSAMVAKISDLGNSRIVDQLAMTCIPGIPAYMPPEALYSLPGGEADRSHYGTELDIFSFGHLSLFTIIQDFPHDLRPPNYPDPSSQGRLVALTEVERRGKYIDQLYRQLGERHPIIQLIKECLDNDPRSRPLSEVVLQRLEGMRSQIRDPYQDLTKVEMMKLLEQKDRKIQSQVQQAEAMEAQLQQIQVACVLKPGTSLQWKNCADLPVLMRSARAVALKNKVYFGCGFTESDAAGAAAMPNIYTPMVYIYTPAVNTWATLPSPTTKSALTTYHSQLVLVGGEIASTGTTNQLWVLQEDERTWTQPLPAMSTARRGATAISHHDHLIVAGGRDKNQWKNVVEVYDGRLWRTTDPLPLRCSYMKTTINDGSCYMMGGDNQGQSVFCASLGSLIANATQLSTTSPNNSGQRSVWETLPDVPYKYSATAMIGGALVAVGGMDSKKTHSSSLFMYFPLTHEWLNIGKLPVGVSRTCTITLSTGELMVIGGSTEDAQCHVAQYSCTVYMASLQ